VATDEVKMLLKGIEFPETTRDHVAVVIDPDTHGRLSLSAGLSKHGYEVWGAQDFRSGVTTIAASAPELVITELRLPDASGLELLSVLRNRAPQTRVLIATVYGSIATAVRAIRWGAVSYVAKPVTADEILNELYNPPCECSEDGLPSRIPKRDATPLTLDRAVWEYVNQVIETAGSLAGAARCLGVDRRNLRRMLAKYAPPPTARPLRTVSSGR